MNDYLQEIIQPRINSFIYWEGNWSDDNIKQIAALSY